MTGPILHGLYLLPAGAVGLLLGLTFLYGIKGVIHLFNTKTMSERHEHLATLAEKLEYSNALRKQTERELSIERVEHGKTKSLVDELREEVRKLQEKLAEPQKTPKYTREERLQILADKRVQELLSKVQKLKTSRNAAIQARNTTLEQLNRVLKDRQPMATPEEMTPKEPEELYHGEYVHLDVLPEHGHLRISLTEEGVLQTANLHQEHPDWNDDCILIDMMQDIPDDLLYIADIGAVDGGHLSNATAIIEGWRFNDPEEKDYVDENYVSYLTNDDSRVWYWNNYMIISVLDYLIRHRLAVLTLLT